MGDFYKKILEEICQEEKIKYTDFSYGYVTMLEKNDARKFINGTHIGNNSYMATLLADDKYAMYEVLKNANLPVVEYMLIWDRNDIKENIFHKIEKLKEYYNAHNQHIVLKPNRGYGGKMVYNIENENQIEPAFKELLALTDTIVANPFYEAKSEHRVIILEGKVRLLYSKIHENEGWQFNLAKGGKVSKITLKSLENALENLAIKAYECIGANFVSIDIFENMNGKLDILEINGSVALEKYLEQQPEEYKNVKNIYRDAILSMFEK